MFSVCTVLSLLLFADALEKIRKNDKPTVTSLLQAIEEKSANEWQNILLSCLDQKGTIMNIFCFI